MTEDFDTDRYCTPHAGLAPVLEYWPGGIDFDPCWDPDSLVEPREHCDIRDGFDGDGLVADWELRVNEGCHFHVRTIFANFPYSDPGLWLRKLAEQITEHPEIEVITLLPSCTDVGWWHEMIPNTRAICYREGRLKFLKNGKTDSKPKGANAYGLHGGFARSQKDDELALRRYRGVFGRVGHVEILG